jgi:RNA polymerase sigma factor (sigma-70 family)
MTTDPSHTSTHVPPNIFATTHWTVVLAAGRRSTRQSERALEELCRTYWFPLYAYVRRRGHSPPDAQDLTQEFFARLLAKHWIESADREKGRFRTFLLTAMSRFLANEWDRAGTQKRGGHAAQLPLETETAEIRYEADSALTLTPDRLYDRQWAMTLLDRALTRLRAEHERAGKAREFSILSPFLTAERGTIPYAEVAAQLGVKEAAARQAVHRVRKRFREVFREEITQTVAAPEETDAEIRHLLAALSG